MGPLLPGEAYIREIASNNATAPPGQLESLYSDPSLKVEIPPSGTLKGPSNEYTNEAGLIINICKP